MDQEQFIEPCKYILCKKKLGDGSYSSVYECKNLLTGSHYAAKMYSKKLVYGLESVLQNEFHILKKVSMNHPNILTLIDYFETVDYLFFVTDLAAGGELFDKIISSPGGKLDENQAIEITRTLISTIDYLHSNNVVHRDLKAENLLFQSKSSKNSNILVADFGLARRLGPGEKVHDISGTLSYIAPEIFDRERGHDFAVDIWSLGVIVYFMLCGYMPFDCETDDETREAILKGDYSYEPSEYWNHISNKAKDFIDQCFKVNPSERATAHDLLTHPFINASADKENLELSISKSSTRPCVQRNNSSNASLTRKLNDSVVRLHLSQHQSYDHHISQQPASSFQKRQRSLSPSKIPYLDIPSSLNSNAFSSVSSKLSLLQNSRNNALIEGVTLLGARCESPDLVSNFTTPLSSTVVSRQQSFNDMSSLMSQSKTMSIEMERESVNNSSKFFI